jgi:hypothetical protein
VRVWIVFEQCVQTNENWVLKVFSTFEKAKEYLDKLLSSKYDKWCTDYFIEQREVE